MTTIEDLRRMAALSGNRDLAGVLGRITQPRRIPADLLAEIERAAGIATASTEKENAS